MVLATEQRATTTIPSKKKVPDFIAHCIFQDDGSETFLTLQRYFQLEENNKWQPIADVHHAHMATPLTVLSVSEGKVFVVKATITLNLEKSMLIIQEGHVFDSAKGMLSDSFLHLHLSLKCWGHLGTTDDFTTNFITW